MSLADELGDELDSQLANGTGPALTLGQSLADELDQEFEYDHTPTPSLVRPARSCRSLRNDGLPSSRGASGMGMSPRKVSTTSTYYTANASPGRLSALDSGDEVDEQLYELSDDEREHQEEEEEEEECAVGSGEDGWERDDYGTNGDMNLARQISIDSAGLPTPRIGDNDDDDMLQVIQDQADEQARFLNLLGTVLPSRTISEPINLSHSLNRSTGTRQGNEPDEVLTRHVERLEEAQRIREVHLRDLGMIRIGVERASILGTRLDPDMLGHILDLLGNDRGHDHGTNVTEDDGDDIPDSPSTVMATPTLGVYDSPTLSSPSRPSDPDYFPFDQKTLHDENDHDSHNDTDDLSLAIQAVIRINQNIISDCLSISESVHLHSQFLQSTTRQIKGLKGTIGGWRDREIAEDNARAALAEWDRSQVERGLRGELGTREVLDGLSEGFQEVLEDCDSRIKEIRMAAKAGPQPGIDGSSV